LLDGSQGHRNCHTADQQDNGVGGSNECIQFQGCMVKVSCILGTHHCIDNEESAKEKQLGKKE